MYKTDRQRAMLDYLQDRPALDVATAMRLFAASSATIRRDFSQLIAAALVNRGPNEIRRQEKGMGVDKPLALREITNRKEKDAIARKACRFLRDGDVVFIDGGTTTQSMAKFLPHLRLRIITPCVRIADMLNRLRQTNSDLEVIMPGGVLSARSYVLYGPQTCRGIESYRADWAFIGVDGMDEAHLYSVNEFIADTQKAMIANSSRTVLLADHSKFGHRSMVCTADLDERFIILTNASSKSGHIIETARRSGVEIISVPV